MASLKNSGSLYASVYNNIYKKCPDIIYKDKWSKFYETFVIPSNNDIPLKLLEYLYYTKRRDLAPKPGQEFVSTTKLYKFIVTHDIHTIFIVNDTTVVSTKYYGSLEGTPQIILELISIKQYKIENSNSTTPTTLSTSPTYKETLLGK
jgi:hypothetical protein